MNYNNWNADSAPDWKDLDGVVKIPKEICGTPRQKNES